MSEIRKADKLKLRFVKGVLYGFMGLTIIEGVATGQHISKAVDATSHAEHFETQAAHTDNPDFYGLAADEYGKAADEWDASEPTFSIGAGALFGSILTGFASISLTALSKDRVRQSRLAKARTTGQIDQEALQMHYPIENPVSGEMELPPTYSPVIQ